MAHAPHRIFRLLGFLALLIAGVARAQQAKVTAEISPNPITPNQVAEYRITVENGQANNIQQPVFQSPIAEMSGMSQSQQVFINNGVTSMSTTFTWGITATQEGSFKIPPVPVTVNGQALNTNEVTLEVKPAAQMPKPDGRTDGQDNGLGQFEPILQLHMPKTEFYTGEIVPIVATLYMPRTERVNLRRIGLVEVEKSDLAIQRFPQQAEQSLETVGNQRYVAMTYRSTLSALKPGKMKVGPAKMDLTLEVLVGGNNRGFPFGFMQMEPRKATVRAAEISINVLPLPSEGKPKSFSGAVGDFTMNAQSSTKEAMVGDPITVDVQIEGTGNFDALEAPKLTDAAGWKTYPPKRYNVDNSDPNTADLANRKLGFNSILVPEKVMSMVPPFEFSFFSPRTKQYTTLRSQPIPVTIKPSPTAAAAPSAPSDAVVSGNTTKAAAPTLPPQADITDILLTLPTTPRWAAVSVPLLNDKRFVAVNALLLLGVIVVVVSTLMKRAKQRRAASAMFALEQLLRSAQEPGLNEAEFYRRAARYVERMGASSVEARAILTRYEALNFAGPAAGSSPVNASDRSQVLEVLKALKPAKVSSPTTSAAVVTALVLLVPMLAQASPGDAYQEAAQALQKNDFKAAQQKAEALVKDGDIGADVFTLLGHAAYKQGKPGTAAMWYQRAQLFPSSIPEVRQNLRHIAERTHFFTFQKNDAVERFSLWFSRNTWLLLATVSTWVSIAGALVFFLTRRMGAIALIPIGILVAALGIIGWKVRPSYEDVAPLAFVTGASAQVHTAATQTSGTVITAPGGSVVRQLDVRGNWAYVEIPQPEETYRGWLPASQIEPVWPYDAAKLP